MRAMVIGALLVIPLAGCGDASQPPRATAPARPEAREIVYLYRVQGDDPLPDSISLRADGTAPTSAAAGAARASSG